MYVVIHSSQNTNISKTSYGTTYVCAYIHTRCFMHSQESIKVCSPLKTVIMLIYICTYVHVLTYVSTYMHTYMHTYVCTYIRMRAHSQLLTHSVGNSFTVDPWGNEICWQCFPSAQHHYLGWHSSTFRWNDDCVCLAVPDVAPCVHEGRISAHR